MNSFGLKNVDPKNETTTNDTSQTDIDTEFQLVDHEENCLALLREDMEFPRSAAHRFFIAVSTASGVSAALLAIGLVAGLVLQEMDDFLQYILRLYIIGFCVLIIMNELRWTTFTRESRLLSNWVSRGILYSFVGLTAVEQNKVSSARSSMSFAVFGLMYIESLGWSMFAIGVVFFIMGVTCMKSVLGTIRTKQAEKKAKSLKELSEEAPNMV